MTVLLPAVDVVDLPITICESTISVPSAASIDGLDDGLTGPTHGYGAIAAVGLTAPPSWRDAGAA